MRHRFNRLYASLLCEYNFYTTLLFVRCIALCSVELFHYYVVYIGYGLTAAFNPPQQVDYHAIVSRPACRFETANATATSGKQRR